VNVTLDMILGIEGILISWFVIILALLGVAYQVYWIFTTTPASFHLSYVYYSLVAVFLFSFYRAMHFSAKRGIAIVCCPSVCLSVCLSVCDVQVS